MAPRLHQSSLPVFSDDPEQNAEMTAEYFFECRLMGVDPYDSEYRDEYDDDEDYGPEEDDDYGVEEDDEPYEHDDSDCEWGRRP